ncbi:MAG: DAK2 domain-containing protein [Anaerolineae bacterium]|nr:DAK2 domain-containing protein [Anaerolineae bacterium]
MGSNDDKIYALEGSVFKDMIWAALSWLRHHQEQINALNVFPVPDGDTGTNMTLTMTSAWNEIADLNEENIGKVVGKVAHGALMGARGNSGVILSQIWRGFARMLDSKGSMHAADLADAMRGASETAYKGVVKPVEGTILTVVREVSEEATLAAQETGDLYVMLERMVERAKAAEARTPSLLPVLRQAGVVDSGGQGFLIILEGMLRHLQGLPAVDEEIIITPEALAAFDPHHDHEGEIDFDEDYPYDVQFLIIGTDMDVPEIRRGIESLGDCPLVVGDPNIIKVHVHVPDPGVPISYGVKWGSVQDVVVEDMRAQFQDFLAGRQLGMKAQPEINMPPLVMNEEGRLRVGVVTVVAGKGMEMVFRSLGAMMVVPGGQTMNPSTAQILEAVKGVNADMVIILPNNKNILMAAQQAAEVSGQHVAVVPTRSIPQGVAALLSMDPDSSLEENVAAMSQAAFEVITAEVTWATRDVALNGVAVREGDAIGLLEGELVVGSQSFEEAAHWLLAEADLTDRELVTLYYGEGVSQEQADALADALSSNYEDLEFEVVEGLQPHYPYIISIE